MYNTVLTTRVCKAAVVINNEYKLYTVQEEDDDRLLERASRKIKMN